MLFTVGCAAVDQVDAQVELSTADTSVDADMTTYQVITPMLVTPHIDQVLTDLDQVQEVQVTSLADMANQNVYGSVRIRYTLEDDRVDKHRSSYIPSYIYRMKSHEVHRHPRYTNIKKHSRI